MSNRHIMSSPQLGGGQCSHCGKSVAKIRRLFAGNPLQNKDICICDECIVLYYEFLAQLLDDEQRLKTERDAIADVLEEGLRIFTERRQVGHVITARELKATTWPDFRSEDDSVISVAVRCDVHFWVDSLSSSVGEQVPSPSSRMPDLVAEVVVERPTHKAMALRAHQYLTLGVRLVWLVFTQEMRVEVWRSGSSGFPVVLSITDNLDGFDVLPGFSDRL